MRQSCIEIAVSAREKHIMAGKRSINMQNGIAVRRAGRIRRAIGASFGRASRARGRAGIFAAAGRARGSGRGRAAFAMRAVFGGGMPSCGTRRLPRLSEYDGRVTIPGQSAGNRGNPVISLASASSDGSIAIS